jgi:hypothetical protein
MRASAIALLVALAGCGGKDGAPFGALSFDELLQACVASSACAVRPYPRVSNCVDAYYSLHVPFGLGPVYDAIYRCVNAARGGCDEVFACYGTHRAAGRCDTGFKAHCDGSKAFSCDTLAGRVFVYDCAAAGLSCLVQASQSFDAHCSTGSCDASYARRCDGARLSSCADGVIETTDCAAHGQRCAVGTGGANCVGSTEEECQSGKFTARCEGSVALSCVGGRVQRSECAGKPLSGRCVDGACAPSGGDCRDEFDRCQGPALEACLNGSWRGFDCAALGFGACQALANGAACSALN